MKISMFILPLIFIILGVLLRFGKASFLIAGYNTSSKLQKEKYNEKALCKFVGNLLFGFAAIFSSTAIAKGLNLTSLDDISIIETTLTIILSIVALIYANTGNRFKI